MRVAFKDALKLVMHSRTPVLTLYAPREGGARGLISVYRRGSVLLMFAPDRARSKCHRRTVQVPSRPSVSGTGVGNVRSVCCAMQ